MFPFDDMYITVFFVFPSKTKTSFLNPANYTQEASSTSKKAYKGVCHRSYHNHEEREIEDQSPYNQSSFSF